MTKTNRINDLKNLKKLTLELGKILIYRHIFLFGFNFKFIRLHFRFKRELKKTSSKYDRLRKLNSKKPSFFLFYKYIPLFFILGLVLTSIVTYYLENEENLIKMTMLFPILLLVWFYHMIEKRILKNYYNFIIEMQQELNRLILLKDIS